MITYSEYYELIAEAELELIKLAAEGVDMARLTQVTALCRYTLGLIRAATADNQE
ncbi:MAG: hypothetical protein PUJ24_04895 [Bacteroidales bacterium]|nr:hypothetical protein [Bacteroidales bacterium]